MDALPLWRNRELEESIIASSLTQVVQTQRQAIDDLSAQLRSGKTIALPSNVDVTREVAMLHKGEMIVNRFNLTSNHRPDCPLAMYPSDALSNVRSIVFEDEPHVECMMCHKIISLAPNREIIVLRKDGTGRIIEFKEEFGTTEYYEVDQISEPVSFMESVTMAKPTDSPFNRPDMTYDNKVANPGGWKSKQKLLDEIGDKWAARDLSALQSLGDLEEELDKVIATI